MMHAAFSDLPPQPADLEALLFWWPSITRRASDGWEKGFCQSVLGQSRRRGWKPSEKQLALMRRMHRDFFAPRLGDEDDQPLVE